MSISTGDNEFEIELEAELRLAESSDTEQAAGRPVSEWLFDPTDVEREEVGLRNLLGAVEELEGDFPRDRRGTGGDA
jgi:hypothetical protein